MLNWDGLTGFGWGELASAKEVLRFLDWAERRTDAFASVGVDPDSLVGG